MSGHWVNNRLRRWMQRQMRKELPEADSRKELTKLLPLAAGQRLFVAARSFSNSTAFFTVAQWLKSPGAATRASDRTSRHLTELAGYSKGNA